MNTGRISVACLTQGINIPSTRFRVDQHIDRLKNYGIDAFKLDSRFGAYAPSSKFKFMPWLIASTLDGVQRIISAKSADVTILQRNIISPICTIERLIQSPLIFDVDDAIFLGRWSGGVKNISSRANLTICGNNFIADYFSKFSNVYVLPTAVDTNVFVPKAKAKAKATDNSLQIIGWSGTSGSFRYLYLIEEALIDLFSIFKNLKLKVVADKYPVFKKIPNERILFELWDSRTEVQSIQDFTVGVMPMEDSPWARGKCSFKMLTYMAVGVPVVVSPIGMNSEVLAMGQCGFAASTKDDWVQAIAAIITNESLMSDMGIEGRRISEEKFSTDIISIKLAKKIVDVANGLT
jgi:glycosyltransferase involved in cell wall biosynthesis